MWDETKFQNEQSDRVILENSMIGKLVQKLYASCKAK